MKYYALFVDGVRAGTIHFNDTECGDKLQRIIKTLAPTVSIRQTDENDAMVKDIRRGYVNNSASCGIGGQMVRKMIEAYEGRVR